MMRSGTWYEHRPLLVPRGLVQRNRRVAVGLHVGVYLLDDGDCSRVHCFDGGEKVASKSRYDYGGDTNWNTLSSLVDYLSVDGANCRRGYLLVAGAVTNVFDSFIHFL